MKCVICKHGSTQPGTVTVTLERGTMTLVFKNVPARVCDNCGEAYVDETTTAQLLQTAEAAVKAGVQVECLPGATAFVPALVNSGIPTNRFSFEGFLPLKKGRQTLMKQLAEEERTMVFYESPMRLVKTLEEFIGYFGEERQCSVSRELTKMFEENKQGTLREVADYFKDKTVKGEIVIIVAGKN